MLGEMSQLNYHCYTIINIFYFSTWIGRMLEYFLA
jgi:hypothetical protein